MPKTHCPHGHAYTPENTRTNSRGQRQCRACNNARAGKGEAARRAVRARQVAALGQIVRPEQWKALDAQLRARFTAA